MARDLDAMREALRKYLPKGKAITRIVPLSTGHSNETYVIEGLERILRMPPSEEGLLPPYDMARQHAILAAVGATADGPPVPRVHELCTDASVIGDPFFVMGLLRGEAFEYHVPDWLARAREDVRSHMCEQWLGAVAALHRQSVSIMPTGQRTVQDEIRHWRAVAEHAETDPRLFRLLDDLKAHPPRASGPATPLHGDPKQGNCLWDQGKLVALLDWEMAGIGEPLTDLGYMLQFYDQGEAALASAGFDLPGWWPRDRTIAEWERATGRTARDVRRYEALAMCKIAAIIALGHHLFRTGRAEDPRFEAWGDVVPKYITLAQQRSEMV